MKFALIRDKDWLKTTQFYGTTRESGGRYEEEKDSRYISIKRLDNAVAAFLRLGPKRRRL